MSLNTTSAWLEARTSPTLLPFFEKVTTSDANLKGAGGGDSDGYPIPVEGRLQWLAVYDGITLHTDSDNRVLSAGSRISVYADNVGGSFTVKVYIDGSPSGMQVTGVAENADLFATVLVVLKEA
ncbi:hypothetical protein GF324_07940 [bacterium]|nr:hypothetical protein [bacterium]